MGGECMQLNRVTWGGVSGLLGVVAMFITRQAWHAYTSSELPRQLGLGVSLGVAVGLYWLADRFGLVRAAYTAPPLSLTDHARVGDSDASADTPSEPKDPPTPSGVPQEKNQAV
jgi:hypothetical protein